MADITIHCQYYENYAAYEGGEHWKPKGGHEFMIKGFDPDFLFYDEAKTIEALKKTVTDQSNNYEKFEYISHELKFGEPTVINKDHFEVNYAETINV